MPLIKQSLPIFSFYYLIFLSSVTLAQFRSTETPYAGEKSWIPIDENPRRDSFSLMFKKLNVFVRLFVRLKNKNEYGLRQVTEYLAKKIDNKILF